MTLVNALKLADKLHKSILNEIGIEQWMWFKNKKKTFRTFLFFHSFGVQCFSFLCFGWTHRNECKYTWNFIEEKNSIFYLVNCLCVHKIYALSWILKLCLHFHISSFQFVVEWIGDRRQREKERKKKLNILFAEYISCRLIKCVELKTLKGIDLIWNVNIIRDKKLFHRFEGTRIYIVQGLCIQCETFVWFKKNIFQALEMKVLLFRWLNTDTETIIMAYMVFFSTLESFSSLPNESILACSGVNPNVLPNAKRIKSSCKEI